MPYLTYNNPIGAVEAAYKNDSRQRHESEYRVAASLSGGMGVTPMQLWVMAEAWQWGGSGQLVCGVS